MLAEYDIKLSDGLLPMHAKMCIACHAGSGKETRVRANDIALFQQDELMREVVASAVACCELRALRL
jgi:hypothetical protein